MFIAISICRSKIDMHVGRPGDGLGGDGRGDISSAPNEVKDLAAGDAAGDAFGPVHIRRRHGRAATDTKEVHGR